MPTIPDRTHRLTIVRNARLTWPRRLANELGPFLGTLARIHPALSPFSAVKDARSLLDGARVSGRSGRDPSHVLRLSNETEGDRWADLSVTLLLEGEGPPSAPGVVVEARLGRFAERAAITAVFDAMVRAFRPDMGFVEPAGTPSPAPARPEEPVVRWLTYRSSASAPAAPPPHASSYGIDALGTVYLATADLPDPDAAAQEEASREAAPEARPVDVTTADKEAALARLRAEVQVVAPPPPSTGTGTADLSDLTAAALASAALPFMPPAARAVPPPPSQVARTVDLQDFMAKALEEALPFTKPAAKPAPQAAPPPPQSARTVDLGSLLADALAKAAPPPPRASEPAPPLTLEQYASLSAELHVHADRAGEVLARYGLSGRPAYDALQSAYAARFAREPAALQTFRQLEAQYRDWLLQSRKPTR